MNQDCLMFDSYEGEMLERFVSATWLTQEPSFWSHETQSLVTHASEVEFKIYLQFVSQ
jgi:hypothetical protein